MPLKKLYNLKSLWTLGKKRKLLAYGMKAFYLINYTDACNFQIQWHDLQLSRKYTCGSKF